jgi:acyl-CoA thioester hydrolase
MNSSINARPHPESRLAYKWFKSVTTRWGDNDVYGHVNNVVYYQWFDTVVNAWLIENGVLNIQQPTTMGVVAETHCNFFESLAYPQDVHIGIRVAHVGASSVRYELGVFGAAEQTAAKGHFVHVYVDPDTRRPVALPTVLIQLLETLK